MKGLRLTQIRSLGFDGGFNRYQLSEHELIPVQSTRRDIWMPGKILHHFMSYVEACEYFWGLSEQYDKYDVELDPTNMELDPK